METTAYEIIYIAFLGLTLVGAIQILLWLKTVFGIVKGLMATLFLVIVIVTIYPFILTGLGVFALGRQVYLFKKKRNSKKDKTLSDIPKDSRSTESLYLESDQGTIEIANIYRGIIIQGGAGSGKSASLFVPFILQLMINQFCGILYDFKAPSLAALAHYYHKKNSPIKFKFLNFKDYTTSDRVNPLDTKYITKQAIAFEVATVLINNLLPESIKKKDYWTRSSISVIAGAIWFLRNNYPQYCTIPHLTAMILDLTSSELIDIISNDIETAGMISSLKEAHEMKAEKQIAGVIGTIKNSIAVLNIPEVFYLMSSDDVDLEINNPSSPTFLAIGNDSTLTETYAPVISLLISVCLRQMNQPHRHKSAVLLDEAPTLYIPNFEQIPATARSNKIATVYGLQDYSQMIDKYGREKAQVMISNLGNQFFGRTVNENTAKMVINLFGKQDEVFTSVSSGTNSSAGGLFGDTARGKSVSSTESLQERERVKISDITNAKPGVFFGIVAEGNKNELLGVRLAEVEENHKPFEKKITEDPREVFKRIHQDILSIKSNKSEIQTDEDEFKIEL